MFLPILFLQQQLISFDFEVGSITGAVRKLSEVSGVKLSVEGVAKDETVFLHVDNRPLKEVLDELAKVTTSQWTARSDGGYRLVRPNSLIQQIKIAEASQRLEIVKAWQRESMKTNIGQPTSNLEAQYTDDLKAYRKAKGKYTSSDPAKFIKKALLAPLYSECVKRVDLAAIAKLQIDDRIVFSSSPTSRQLAFTQPINNALQKLNKILSLWRGHLENAGLRGKSVPVDSRQFESSVLNCNRSNATLPFARPLKSLVLSFSGRIYGSIFVTMALVNDLGQVVAAWTCDSVHVDPPRSSQNIKLAEIEHAIPQPPRISTRAFFEARQQGWQKKPGDLTEQEVSNALAPYFDDPVNHDFLNLGNQEFLSTLGATLRRSIIACVPDGQYLPYSEQSIERFANAGIGDATSSRISNAWVEFFPTKPASHWRNRGNREALARCAKGWREHRTIPMGDFALLVNEDATADSWIREFAQLMMPRARNDHSNSQVAHTSAKGMGPLLASLTDSQTRDLLTGKTIRYRNLRTNQRRYCESILFGVSAYRNIGGEATTQTGWEPTLELPTGLNDQMGITAKMIDEHYLIAHDTKEAPDNDIRETMALDNRPERFNGAELGCGNYARANRWMKFEFRTRRRFALKCYLTKGHYYCVDYYEPMQPDTGKRITVDQLSPSLLAKILKMNFSFNSRAVEYIGKDGQTWVRTETYKEPKQKKK